MLEKPVSQNITNNIPASLDSHQFAFRISKLQAAWHIHCPPVSLHTPWKQQHLHRNAKLKIKHRQHTPALYQWSREGAGEQFYVPGNQHLREPVVVITHLHPVVESAEKSVLLEETWTWNSFWKNFFSLTSRLAPTSLQMDLCLKQRRHESKTQWFKDDYVSAADGN